VARAARILGVLCQVRCITQGPLFRGIDRHGHLQAERLHPCSVARIVKRCAERAGLDPEKFAGHSLRAGFATTAAKRGKSLDAIMRQTLHRSERAKLFDDNAAGGLFERRRRGRPPVLEPEDR
jgi:integrase